jgi:23S rRNA (uracil1939-C5)-methyltransferase
MARKRKTPVSLKAQITGLSHEGRGITHIEGKTTFVFNALPGETVMLELKKTRGSFNEAVATEILEPSTERINPSCEHFGTCGGCALQHAPQDLQIKIKQQALQELLQQQAKTQPEQWLPAITDSSTGYRRKARLSVKHVPGKEKVLVGFRERNGRFVANINQCEVLHPTVGLKITALSDFLMTLEAKSQIPQIEVAVSDNTTTLIIRHLKPLSSTDETLISEFGKQHAFNTYLQSGGMETIKPLDAANDTKLYYDLKNQQCRLYFQPQQFIQVNAGINQKMIDSALKLLDLQPEDSLLDLFCGIGNFSIPIAKQCAAVCGIEGDHSAVAQAIYNSKINELDNTEFFYANLFENDYNQDWAGKKYHKILLDPPRAGAKEIITQFHRWQPEKVVYVSCNAATLARDTALLLEQGYCLATAGVMDMFPHTQHAEAITLFVKSDERR